MASSVSAIEVLGLISSLAARLRGERVLYCRQTLAFKLFSRFLPTKVLENCHWISYGDLKHVTEIRRTAYRLAEAAIEKLNFKAWQLRPLKKLGAENDLIVEKLLMQQLFDKYEFYGLVVQYAREHPEARVKLLVDPLLFDDSLLAGLPDIAVKKQGVLHRSLYRLSPILIVVYIAYFNRRHATASDAELEDAVLCEIDSVVVYQMFEDLLGGMPNLHYLAKSNYLPYLTQRPNELTVHGMNARKMSMLKEVGWSLIAFGLSAPKGLPQHGLILFDLVRMFAHGILVTPSAKRSAYLTFEHLTVEKAIRNEILKLDGNKSVFVPYNIYTSSPYYVPEYKLNYDILCSPGELCEKSYKLQQASTSVILRTGSYHANKRLASLGAEESRVAALREFVKDSVCITVLCNGSDDITRSGEERLIDLAGRLADQQGIKVLVRQKPTPPSSPYRNFYTDRVGNNPNVKLTHSEFDLYDFLNLTDLFITSNSSSILEFCAAEKPIFAVDFWKRTDLFNWQTAVPGIYLQEEEAFATILEWCRSPAARAEHALCVKELARLVSHSFPDFLTFKKNFRDLLGPNLPALAAPHLSLEGGY